METFFVLLAFCAGNSPVTGEFPAQRPVTRSFYDFFDMCLDKRLSKQSRRRWFKTPPRSLWRHCNGVGMVVADRLVHISSRWCPHVSLDINIYEGSSKVVRIRTRKLGGIFWVNGLCKLIYQCYGSYNASNKLSYAVTAWDTLKAVQGKRKLLEISSDFKTNFDADYNELSILQILG